MSNFQGGCRKVIILGPWWQLKHLFMFHPRTFGEMMNPFWRSHMFFKMGFVETTSVGILFGRFYLILLHTTSRMDRWMLGSENWGSLWRWVHFYGKFSFWGGIFTPWKMRVSTHFLFHIIISMIWNKLEDERLETGIIIKTLRTTTSQWDEKEALLLWDVRWS